MKYDPYDPNRFAAKNLDPDFLRQCQDDSWCKETCEDIKGAFILGYGARLHKDVLLESGLRIACEADLHAMLLQVLHHDHWLALSLGIMSHGYIETSKEDDYYRFYKSSFDNLVMYGDNVDYIVRKGERWYTPILKNQIKLPEPEQASLF